eukprot:COSAG05_NODE_2503_length_2969_cov_1.890125_3_plen_394_part_00
MQHSELLQTGRDLRTQCTCRRHPSLPYHRGPGERPACLACHHRSEPPVRSQQSHNSCTYLMRRAAAAGKPWRLSSSVVIAATSSSVPGAGLDVAEDGACDYKICMVRRAPKSTFMPAVSVFPGGALDKADKDVAARLCGRADDESIAMIAAARECFEEAGVVMADAPIAATDSAEMTKWRAVVRSDPGSMASLYTHLGAKPATASQLLPICSFVTPDVEHERLEKGGFLAKFYLFCCTDIECLKHAKADASETVSLAWLSPRQALEASDSGQIFLAPPQWFILNDLAPCEALSELPATMAAAGSTRRLVKDYPIKPYGARMDPEDRARFESTLVYPGDAKHPIFPGPENARHRMMMTGTFGQKMKYGLKRCGLDSLRFPLSEQQQGWVTLAKL